MVTTTTPQTFAIQSNPAQQNKAAGKGTFKAAKRIVLVVAALIVAWVGTHSGFRVDTMPGPSQAAASSVSDPMPRVAYFPSQYPPVTATDTSEQPATF